MIPQVLSGSDSAFWDNSPLRWNLLMTDPYPKPQGLWEEARGWRQSPSQGGEPRWVRGRKRPESLGLAGNMAQPNNGSEEKVRQRRRQHCRQSTGNHHHHGDWRNVSEGTRRAVAFGSRTQLTTDHSQGGGPGVSTPLTVPPPPHFLPVPPSAST